MENEIAAYMNHYHLQAEITMEQCLRHAFPAIKHLNVEIVNNEYQITFDGNCGITSEQVEAKINEIVNF